jgi:hypothetical protein
LKITNNDLSAGFSPDRNVKPGTIKSSFSRHKKATKGSSFYGVEKHFL